MKVGIIVQARMTSTRFPGKPMALLHGRPVLWHVLTAALKIGPTVILAVPCQPISLPMVELGSDMGCAIYTGTENDVLRRYNSAATCFELDVIMRITADCPKLDPDVCKRVLDAVPTADYASNVRPRTYEKGLDCEAFTRGALVNAHHEAVEMYDREHVTPWMQRALGNTANIESGNPERAEKDWCVDTPDQLQVMNEAA